MEHLQKIFTDLKLNKGNGLFIREENRWRNIFSNRIERLIDNVIQPDAFFCIDNKPFILFFENLRDVGSKFREIWNFNEAPVVFIVSDGSVDIYNGYNYIRENLMLQSFNDEGALNNFNYFNLVTGETWEKYSNDFSYTNRIDFHLLSNIKAARRAIVNDSGIDVDLANSLIGKTIFVRYLIDRKVKLNFDGNPRVWTTAEFCDILASKQKTKQFFKYLKDKFNGDLFSIASHDFDEIPKGCFQVLINLLKGKEVATGQLSLFDLYDFSIIPVEFISNVYELFIGQQGQEEQGAYYTPLFLVDYILNETIERKIQSNAASSRVRVLDPACGSGIFLVESLRKIIERHNSLNPPKSTRSQTYKDTLTKLATENIYGIDKDKSAVNVAIFSIYLTLLDYQQPSDIETFRFPPLLDRNFFVADFFDLQHPFNSRLLEIPFDFIVGNPPWKRGHREEIQPLFLEYINHRKLSEGPSNVIRIAISNNEIAQAFVLRVSDFSTARTKFALVVTSKMFYNINAKEFRSYLLDRYLISRIFELAPVRKQVFDKSNDSAVGPAAVIFYQHANGRNTDSNIIEHITLKPNRFFSLFKVFTIQRNDYKRVQQEQLKKFDYLWKVLVYGNYLDFNLIAKLKTEFANIDSIIRNDEFTISQGIIIGKKDRDDDVSDLIGLPFLDTSRDIDQFWINEDTEKRWTERFVHRSRSGKRNIFKGPALLVTGGVSSNLRSVSAFSKGGFVFKSSLTAIRSDDVDTLKTISGILNSSFFSYYSLLTFSSTGIEREESHDEEKFGTPYSGNPLISEMVTEIEDLKRKVFSNQLKNLNEIESKIDHTLAKLDKAIASSFYLNNQELALIDYANQVSIPLLRQSKTTSKRQGVSKEVLEAFASIFLERFNEVYRTSGQALTAEIILTTHIVAIFFKLDAINMHSELNYVTNESEYLLKRLYQLGVRKVTDRLFIQKDIRGFETNGFYIVKPNDIRLWHESIAYLDVNEFAEAIISAGQKRPAHVQ